MKRYLPFLEWHEIVEHPAVKAHLQVCDVGRGLPITVHSTI
jgi:hypothetical protein